MMSADPNDGGLPPGGAPQQACGSGPCPACVDARQVSSPCVLASAHDGPHRCGFGDVFAEPASKCLELCPHFDGWCIRDKGHDGVHWCGRHDY